MNKKKKEKFKLAKRNVEVTVGESIRIMREFNEFSQSELSGKTKIPQATISALENNRISLGVERAKVLARALHCHPAILLFPDWDTELESNAA